MTFWNTLPWSGWGIISQDSAKTVRVIDIPPSGCIHGITRHLQPFEEFVAVDKEIIVASAD